MLLFYIEIVLKISQLILLKILFDFLIIANNIFFLIGFNILISIYLIIRKYHLVF